ncbi:MAG: hypothetical protein V3S56_01125 [Gemmatimonadota bacterium]
MDGIHLPDTEGKTIGARLSEEQRFALCRWNSSRGSSDWCCFILPASGVPPRYAETALDLLRSKYTVYLAASDIPQDQKEFYLGQFSGYRNGFLLRISAVELISAKAVRITYKEYRTGLAATSHWELYEWDGSDWVLKQIGPVGIS